VWPEGAETDDNLQPLLLSRQDTLASPGTVRRDVSTLFRVGEFRAVEVDAVPYPYETEAGNVVEGVVLTFSVFPAPRVHSVVLGPSGGVSRSKVLDAARISVGQPYYAELDATPGATRIEGLYARQGYPDAEATLVEVEQDNHLTVFIDVEPGQPRTATDVVFAGVLPVSQARLRRWARQSGVRRNQPVSAEAVSDAQFHIRRQLARLRTFPVQSGGWVEARVTPALVLQDDGTAQVAFTLDPGKQLRVAANGLSLRANAKVIDALGIDERTRLTRGFVAAAPERIETRFQDSGYLATSVTVALDESRDTVQTLVVDISRGPRHSLTDVNFVGNDAVEGSTLRAVMDQQSPDILRLRKVTPEAVDDALPTLLELYRSRGYQEASVTRDPLSIEPSGGLFSFLKPEPNQHVTVTVEIDEGPLSTLAGIMIDGSAEEVDLNDERERASELVGGPYSPQALAGVAQAVVERHREQGYLEADARITADDLVNGRTATLSIRPGPRVLLRSVVLRGAARTRPNTIRREVDLPLGEPVTTGDLERVRRDLYDLGVFRTATTELLGDGPLRDLVVSVEEQKRWAFELGGGVSTDQGLRSFGRATRRNLWGRAHRVSLYGLLGIDWRSDSLSDWTPDIRDPEWRAAVTYDAPHFPFLNQHVLVDLLMRERVQERTWQMARSGLGIAIDTTLDNKTTLRTGIRMETRTLQEVDVGALLDGEPWTDLLDIANPQLPSTFRFQDSLTALLFHDRRDSQFAPSRGFSLSIHGEIAPGLPAGRGAKRPVRFAKSEIRATGYIPLGGLVLRTSGDIGAIAMLDDGILGLEDRYRLGGTGNLRGFRRDTLGPRNRITNPDLGWSDRLGPIIEQAGRVDPDRWTPTGGDARVLASIELIAPLPALGLRAWDGYAAALFADVGNVWLLTPDVDSTSEAPAIRNIFDPIVRYSIGAGIRVATPVGPLQVDLATNPEAMVATGERRILLREQWREPLLRAHISLGTLF
jgi:outer membrane protein insertion porin family